MSLATLPALSLPPGVKSNFENPESRGYVLIAVGSPLLAIMVIFLAIRFYTKLRITRSATWDDLTCCLAALLTTAYFAVLVLGVNQGPVGKHQYDVTLQQLADPVFTIGMAFLTLILVPPALLAAKLTFFLLYYQLFRPLRWLRIAVYVGATLTTAFYIAVFVMRLVIGTPKPGQTWFSNLFGPGQTQEVRLAVPTVAVGLGIDCFLLVLPLRAVASLQLPHGRKVGVFVVFTTGLLACIASALSLYYRVLLNRSRDTTWDMLNVMLTGLVELEIGVIVSCMPSVSKLVKHHLPTLKSYASTLRGRRGGTRHGLLSGSGRAGFSSSQLPQPPTKESRRSAESGSDWTLPIFGTTSASTATSGSLEKMATWDHEAGQLGGVPPTVQMKRYEPIEDRRVQMSCAMGQMR